MGVLQFPTPIPMTNGNYPNLKFGVFTDNLATVTTAGYLNQSSIEAGMPLSNADIVFALYSYSTNTHTGSFAILTVSIAASNGQITLTAWGDPGSVVLPTIANHIATYTNTIGGLSEDPATAISGGNIQAGLSGTAGYLASFPATAATGSLELVAASNAGNTVTQITNASFGQATVLTIPDPGAATANFALNNGSATILNHIATYKNTTGLLGEDASTAINGGSLQAGLSGTAGTVTSFPATASEGFLRLAAVNNASGNFSTTISNAAAILQSQVLTVPDVGSATGNFVVSNSLSGQSVTMTVASATPANQSLAVTAADSTTLTSGALNAITGLSTIVSSSGAGVSGVSGYVTATGTLSSTSQTQGISGVLTLTGATVNGGTVASITGELTGTAPTQTSMVNTYGVLFTNTTTAVLNAQLGLTGDATYLMNLQSVSTYFAASGTSAGSWGNATPPTPSHVLAIKVGGTAYYLPLVAQNT